MKVFQDARAQLRTARDALTKAIEAAEPHEVATLTAEAGDAIARSIAGMDSTFKGYRRDVETRAARLAAKVLQ